MVKNGYSSQDLGLQLAKELYRWLENILDEQVQVTQLGSQAQCDATDESDVDMLVVLPDQEKNTLDTVLEIAWEIGFEAGKVISVVPATRDELPWLSASPFFQTVQREGVSV